MRNLVVSGLVAAGSAIAAVPSGPEGLPSSGPLPALAEDLRLYGQFVGQWEFDVVNYRPDGSTTTGKGEWNFAWVLDGRAVQDVWITPARGQRQTDPNAREGYGTTLRFYDPKLDAWRILWVDPVHGNVQPMVARLRGGEIVQDGIDSDDGGPMRWVFFDIGPDAFRWRAESSSDGGKTWVKLQEMSVRRRR